MAGVLADHLVKWRKISQTLMRWEVDIEEATRAAFRMPKELNSDIMRWRAADAGCVPPLIHLLKMEELKVQTAAVEALVHLITPTATMGPSPAAGLVVRAGTVPALVDIVVRDCVKGGKVVAVAAECLIGLTASEEGKEAICATDLLHTLLEVLDEYAFDHSPEAPPDRRSEMTDESIEEGNEDDDETNSEDSIEEAMIREAQMRQVPLDRRLSIGTKTMSQVGGDELSSKNGRMTTTMALLLTTLLAALTSSDAFKLAMPDHGGMGVLVRMLQSLAGVKKDTDLNNVALSGHMGVYVVAAIAQLVDGAGSERNQLALLDEPGALPLMLAIVGSPRVVKVPLPQCRDLLAHHGAADKVIRYLHTAGNSEGQHIAAATLVTLNAIGVWSTGPRPPAATETPAKVVQVLVKGLLTRLDNEMPEMLLEVVDYTAALRAMSCNTALVGMIAECGGVAAACQLLAQCGWGSHLLGQRSHSSSGHFAALGGGDRSGGGAGHDKDSRLKVSSRKRMELLKCSRRTLALSSQPGSDDDFYELEGRSARDCFFLLMNMAFHEPLRGQLTDEGAYDLFEGVEGELLAARMQGVERPYAQEIRRCAKLARFVLDEFELDEDGALMAGQPHHGHGDVGHHHLHHGEGGAAGGHGSGSGGVTGPVQVVLCAGPAQQEAMGPVQEALLQGGVTTWMSGAPAITFKAEVDVVRNAHVLVLGMGSSTRNSPSCRLEHEWARKLGKATVPVLAERGYVADSWVAEAAAPGDPARPANSTGSNLSGGGGGAGGREVVDLTGEPGSAGHDRAVAQLLASLPGFGILMTPRGLTAASGYSGHPPPKGSRLPHIAGSTSPIPTPRTQRGSEPLLTTLPAGPHPPKRVSADGGQRRPTASSGSASTGVPLAVGSWEAEGENGTAAAPPADKAAAAGEGGGWGGGARPEVEKDAKTKKGGSSMCAVM